MENSEKKNNKLKIAVILLAILLIAAIAVICLFLFQDNDSGGEAESSSQSSLMAVDDAADWEGNKGGYTGKKNTDTIDIPGFDTISFQADVKEQHVNFYNPESNTCYFKMSLLLADGTKLWESNLIEPGKAAYEITLNKTLPVGTYEQAMLRYECFAMDEIQTPLNGSEIKFTLNVLE